MTTTFGIGRDRPVGCLCAGLLALLVLMPWREAEAQDADFQAFFFDVCDNPTGALAVRCAQTPGGDGALAGDSQESLNPSQTLSGSDTAQARARALAAETQKRLEQLADEAAEKPVVDEGVLEFGRWSLLAAGRGEWFDQNREPEDRERSFDGETYGLQIGADYRLETNLVVGAMFRYDHTDNDFDQDLTARNFVPAPNEGGSESDHYHLMVFASRAITESFHVDGEVGVGYSDLEFERDVVFLETNRAIPQTNVLTAGDTHGWQTHIGVGAGYDLSFGALSVGPYARTRYVRTDIDGYTEEDLNNSGLAMQFGDNDTTSWVSVIGARASYAVSQPWGVVVPQVRIEWEHEFRDDPNAVEASFVQDTGDTRFAVLSDPPDRNYYNVGAGLRVVLPNGWMPYVDYEALVGYEDRTRHRATAGLRAEF